MLHPIITCQSATTVNSAGKKNTEYAWKLSGIDVHIVGCNGTAPTA